jgi:thymidylate synthase (FAD)
MGDDLSIVRSARVSYDASWRKTTTKTSGDAELIRYLKRNGHNTPFESVVFTFEIIAPIFVTRQWMRHRTQSYNEVSARYTELPNKFFVPELKDITYQSTYNKQMRTSEMNEFANEIREELINSYERSYASYEALLMLNCPREIARAILPTGIYTHFFTTMNLHNLFGFLYERLHKSAQHEIKVYAEAMLELITPQVPIAVEAFKEFQLRIET